MPVALAASPRSIVQQTGRQKCVAPGLGMRMGREGWIPARLAAAVCSGKSRIPLPVGRDVLSAPPALHSHSGFPRNRRRFLFVILVGTGQ